MSEDLTVSQILKTLKSRINSSTKTLEIQTSYATLVEVVFTWNKGIEEDQLLYFLNDNNWIIPDDYKQFLLLHNGCTMFKHVKYGGGVHFFSTAEIIDMWESNKQLTDKQIPIAATTTAVGMIFIDSDKVESKEYPYLYFLDAINTLEEAEPIRTDFTTFLNRYVITQGEEYWLWESDDKIRFKTAH